MSGFKEPDFSDRQKSANDARKALLERFKAQPGPDDPAVKARAVERAAIAESREKARIIREAKKAEEKRLGEEAALADAIRIEEEKKSAALAAAALEAERKAARDARYAARKNKLKSKRKK